MSGGVAVAEDSVLASAYDLSLVDDDCTYGDFAGGFGGLGFGYSEAEIVEVFTHFVRSRIKRVSSLSK